MPFIAQNPQGYIGQSVGNGQCVAYVCAAANAPSTPNWESGALVKNSASIQIGTAIATFDPDGTYGNHTDGRSHAAIYLSQDASGLVVLDQWMNVTTDAAGHIIHTPQPVHQRTLRFGQPGATPANDGNEFYIIEQA